MRKFAIVLMLCLCTVFIAGCPGGVSAPDEVNGE